MSPVRNIPDASRRYPVFSLTLPDGAVIPDRIAKAAMDCLAQDKTYRPIVSVATVSGAPTLK